MTEHEPRNPYTPETLQACEKALRTVLARIGVWGGRVYLIGGLVPQYLIGKAPSDMKEHVGTTDLDIVVGIALESQETEFYRTLQRHLKDAGFEPTKNPETGQEQSFQWGRKVDGIDVLLEFFCPVGDGTPGSILRNPGEGVGSRIGAIRTTGAELVALDSFPVSLSGETLDGGGIRENVVAHVANLLPFIVLKAFALAGRVKDKDSYDIVWTLNAFAGGIEGAAHAMKTSPVCDHADTVRAIEILREHFRTLGHSGPSQYANFESSSNSEDERFGLMRFALGTVQEFLRYWDA
ncbi:hypothetical protein SAMN05421770_104317 [Granulicella rosea]|uniref:Nucleotidyl transferase AbiEii toxin, Type IV TA system n=1 Tax=Granulicella rosea TaxID=474952 RepID=A0A239K5M2_9BACT|nr:hypothetical protein [Granulicella rosea]SNT13415.1 hypothetical protein SAMN05421770_104317 [Granulicella rosea]